jgi:hypothetical protein
MTDVTLDCLFGQVEAVANLTVDQPLGDELENLDLSRGRCVLRLGRGGSDREVEQVGGWRAARRDSLEALCVLAVAHKNFVSLCGVHEAGIGVASTVL